MSEPTSVRALTWLTRGDELAAIAGEWRDLQLRVRSDRTLFQTHSWVAAWCRHFGDEGELRVLVGRSPDRLVLVWPMVLRRQGAWVRVLEPAGGVLSCYGDVLLDPDVDHSAWLIAAWDAVEASHDADAVAFSAVRADAHVAPLVERFEGDLVHVAAAPQIACGEDGFDAYMAGCSKVMRKGQRRARRRLDAAGVLVSQPRDEACDPGALIEHGVDLKRQWLRARGLATSPIVSDAGVAFMKDVCSSLDCGGEGIRVRVSTLRHDDELLAMSLGFEQAGRYYDYFGAFDLRYESFGPGRLQIEESLRASFDGDVVMHDLLTPDTEAKGRWRGACVPVRSYLVPLSVRGRLYRDVYLQRARPMLKAAYNKVVPGVRRKLAVNALRRALRDRKAS